MTGDEPWDATFPAWLLDRLASCWAASLEQRAAVLAEAAGLLEQAVRQGVLRPLCLSYDQQNQARAALHTTYRIITLHGFLAVIRFVNGRFELKTAFFPDAVRSQRPSRRWIAAVRSQVEQFATPWRVGDRDVLALPGPGDQLESLDPAGFRVNIVFHDPDTWGFRNIQLPDQDGPMMVWTHPLPWPGHGGAAAGEPRKLKKPRRDRGKS